MLKWGIPVAQPAASGPVSPHMWGRLNCVSKTARSLVIVGDPNESMIAIVSPCPSSVAWRLAKLYEAAIDAGVKHLRPPELALAAKQSASVGGVSPLLRYCRSLIVGRIRALAAW